MYIVYCVLIKIFRSDVTVMADWALKISFFLSFLSLNIFRESFLFLKCFLNCHIAVFSILTNFRDLLLLFFTCDRVTTDVKEL